MEAPHARLREYVAVLRAVSWEGMVNYHGRFFTTKATLPRPPYVPIRVFARSAPNKTAAQVGEKAGWLRAMGSSRRSA